MCHKNNNFLFNVKTNNNNSKEFFINAKNLMKSITVTICNYDLIEPPVYNTMRKGMLYIHIIDLYRTCKKHHLSYLRRKCTLICE